MDLQAKTLVEYPPRLDNAFVFVRQALRDSSVFKRATVIRRIIQDRNGMMACVLWVGLPMDVLGDNHIHLIHVVVGDVLIQGQGLCLDATDVSDATDERAKAKMYMDKLIDKALITLDEKLAKQHFVDQAETIAASTP